MTFHIKIEKTVKIFSTPACPYLVFLASAIFRRNKSMLLCRWQGKEAKNIVYNS